MHGFPLGGEGYTFCAQGVLENQGWSRSDPDPSWVVPDSDQTVKKNGYGPDRQEKSGSESDQKSRIRFKTRTELGLVNLGDHNLETYPDLQRWLYCMSRKEWPVLYSNLLYQMRHYFLDRRYSTLSLWPGPINNLIWRIITSIINLLVSIGATVGGYSTNI